MEQIDQNLARLRLASQRALHEHYTRATYEFPVGGHQLQNVDILVTRAVGESNIVWLWFDTAGPTNSHINVTTPTKPPLRKYTQVNESRPWNSTTTLHRMMSHQKNYGHVSSWSPIHYNGDYQQEEDSASLKQ